MRRPNAFASFAVDRAAAAGYGAIVVTLGEIAGAMRLLAERNRVIAEGAGAASVAAALTGRAGAGKVVCIVSGGNIDLGRFCEVVGGA